MEVTFYFDPSCPFCWVTSRWLLMVSNKRELKINWKPFSLAIKNNELDGNKSGYNHMPAHRVVRVLLAASELGADLGELYKAFGIQHFLAGEEYSDEVIAQVLDAQKLDAGLAKSADDISLDAELKSYIDEAVATVGQDIGVPTIVFNNQEGKATGFFGPVIQTLPDQEESLKLWDAFITLAEKPYFFELKRGRETGGPDVVSTAKC